MKKSIFMISALTFIFCTNSFAQKENNDKEVGAVSNVGKKSIKIHSSNRNIELQSWKEDKIKITSSISNVENQSAETLEKFISVREMSTSINININTVNWGGPNSSKKEITIYVPQSSKISLDSKYGNVTLKNDFDNIDLDITNGNLDAENIGQLKLESKYGNANFAEIKNGEVDFMNGNFSASSIGEAELDTKYSNIEIGTVKKLDFTSTNDEYEIDEVKDIVGRKNYGNLRISKLTAAIDIAGTNTDVKIKSIASSVTSIKFDDKYANLRLPLKNLKDYNVDIKGTYNTVYPDKQTTDLENKYVTELDNSYNFKNGTGTSAKVQIKCSNCTIDLK